MATTRNIKGDLVEEIPFQTIGGSSIPQPIQGSQGLISTAEAVAQEVKKGIGDLAIVLTQGQAHTEKGLDKVAKILTDLKDTQISIARDGKDAFLSGSSGAPSAPRMPSGEVAAPSRHEAPQLFSEGFSASRRNFSVGNVRQALGARLSDRLTDWEFGDSPVIRTPNGDFLDSTTGKFLDPESSEVQGLLKNEMITSAVRGGAQSLAEGKSIGAAANKALGALPGGSALLKGLGVAGAGVAAFQMTTNFMEDQRKKNAEWQSQLGGTQVNAFGERWNQRMFGLSQMGFMGSEDAQRLYKEVAMTGLQGDERTQAQGFALQNYRSMGMSIEESMKFVRESAKMGTDSLVGLSGALKRVSNDARDAGINAEMMRKQMFANWEASTAQTGAGIVSSTTAEALTGYFGDSRALAEVDTSGMLNQSMLRRISARTGMSVNQIRLRSAEEPGWQARQIDTFVSGGIESIAPGLAGFLRSAGITKVSQDNEEEVQAAVTRWADGAGIADVMQLRLPIKSMFNVDLPDDILAVTSYLARAALGQLNAEKGYDEAAGAYSYDRLRDMDPEKKKAFVSDFYNNYGALGREYITGLGQGGQAGGLAQKLVESGSTTGIKRLRDAEGKEHGVISLLRSPGGIEAINRGDFTVVGGDNDGKALTEALGMSAIPMDEGAESRQKVNVEIGLTEEAKKLLTARYDSKNNPDEPHT